MDEKELLEYLNNDTISPRNDPNIVHKLSVTTVHSMFRNGPVEDMHADGKLSDNDMMNINKFLVNRMAYVFTLLLDSKKLECIKEHCNNEDVDWKLVHATIEYAFFDGIKKNKIPLTKLNKQDINILVDYMEIKLVVILGIILKGKISMIKKYLFVGAFQGLNWDYAVPDNMDFEIFLDMIKLPK
ncbi:hypothetical protein [Clostridium sp. ZBS12]|uniref:hypothetical protein n=1 Tax=Clostridium sp. ZBS12 TaxID=2949972 RepID=UPI00207AB6E5|nr:hypothetical protein [Clostridium sp. ZBS12]